MKGETFMDNIVGNRLKKLRTEQQLTMEMMVEDFNMKFGENLNTSQVSRWENGKTDPGLSTGAKLAMYYNVSLDYLIGLTDVKTPSRLLALATRQKSPEVPVLNNLDNLRALTGRDRTIVIERRPGMGLSDRYKKNGDNNDDGDDDFEFDFIETND